jgi:hypothetical protein
LPSHHRVVFAPLCQVVGSTVLFVNFISFIDILS